MGHDEVRPVSEQVNDSWRGFGITLVDALDTMLLMGLEEQFHRALLHVESISWEKVRQSQRTGLEKEEEEGTNKSNAINSSSCLGCHWSCARLTVPHTGL